MTIRAVAFDWGGTITPWNDFPRDLQWRQAAAVMSASDVDECTVALVDAETDIWRAVAEGGQVSSIRTVPRAAAASLGLQVTDLVCDEVLAAHLRAMAPYIHARPDARTTLLGLRDRHISTGILTSSHWPPEWHERLYVEDGLADLLDACVYGAELDYAKPHPDSFRRLLARLDVAADEAVFVGDRPEDDIQGAQAVGMRTIWIPNGHFDADGIQPDAVVTDLVEVLDVIDDWMEAAPT